MTHHPCSHPAQHVRTLATVALFCSLGALSACRGSASHTIPRRLDGVAQRGPFVSPFSYEHYVRAELAAAQGDWETASAQFEMALAGSDPDAYLLSRLARAQARSGQPQAAWVSLREADRLDPCSEAAWMARGEIAELAHEESSAIEAYRRAADCAPYSDQGVLALARMLRATGANVRADEVLRAFCTRVPPPRGGRAALQLAIEQGDSSAARHGLADLLQRQAVSARVLIDAAESALRADRPHQARQLLAHVRTSVPVTLQARTWIATGETDRAAALLLRTPTEQLGGAADAAQLLYEAGALQEAIILASRSLAQTPSASLRALYARALAELGQTDLALQAWQGPTNGGGEALALMLREQGLEGLAEEVAGPLESDSTDTNATSTKAPATPAEASIPATPPKQGDGSGSVR